MILTRTTIDVEEPIVGHPPVTLEISEYGGRVGDLILVASGQVTYRTGETVLVFACRDAGAQLRTCGAHQGRMELVTVAGGGLEARGVIAGRPFQESLSALLPRIRAAREGSR
jgi:hypothetical protein